MSRKRIYRSPEQWQKLIEEFEHSGENVACFCKRLSISESRFYIWRKKLAAQNTENSSAEPFIEYPPQLKSSTAEDTSSWDVELDLGDIVLRLRRS